MFVYFVNSILHVTKTKKCKIEINKLGCGIKILKRGSVYGRCRINKNPIFHLFINYSI